MINPVPINPYCGQCDYNGGYICHAAFELERENDLQDWFTTTYQRSIKGHCKPWGELFERAE